MANVSPPGKLIRASVSPDVFRKFKASATVQGLTMQDAMAVAMGLFIKLVEESEKEQRNAA